MWTGPGVEPETIAFRAIALATELPRATTNISLKLPYILEWQAIFTQTSKRGPLTRYPTCMKRTLHVHVHVRLVQPKVNQAPNGYTSKEETTRWFRGNKLEALARLGLELGLGFSVHRTSQLTTACWNPYSRLTLWSIPLCTGNTRIETIDFKVDSSEHCFKRCLNTIKSCPFHYK